MSYLGSLRGLADAGSLRGLADAVTGAVSGAASTVSGAVYGGVPEVTPEEQDALRIAGRGQSGYKERQKQLKEATPGERFEMLGPEEIAGAVAADKKMVAAEKKMVAAEKEMERAADNEKREEEEAAFKKTSFTVPVNEKKADALREEFGIPHGTHGYTPKPVGGRRRRRTKRRRKTKRKGPPTNKRRRTKRSGMKKGKRRKSTRKRR
jgi:hypothetical protein